MTILTVLKENLQCAFCKKKHTCMARRYGRRRIWSFHAERFSFKCEKDFDKLKK